jgi:hypothetical protein
MRMTDAISRRAVLGMAYCAIKPTHDNPSVVSVVNVEDIEQLPTLDVAPVVHARWIYSGDMDSDGNSQGYCSRCGAGDKHRADLKNLVPYCWKCGARMDGEVDE